MHDFFIAMLTWVMYFLSFNSFVFGVVTLATLENIRSFKDNIPLKMFIICGALLNLVWVIRHVMIGQTCLS